MPRSSGTSESTQQDLFEQEKPDITLPPSARDQTAAAIEALIAEIAKAFASREASDDQDHG